MSRNSQVKGFREACLQHQQYYTTQFLILSREPEVNFTRSVFYKYTLTNYFLYLNSCSVNIHYYAYY